jgi:signal transduction histidine kinase
MRAVVAGLVPTDLAGDGLCTALRKQVELLDRVHAPRIRVTTDTECPMLRADRQEAAYRIAQEALHNALRHAAPARIDVTLRSSADGVELSIVDDGTGFDARAAEMAGRRLGLVSMRERARAVGGRIELDSSAGRGTTVRLVLPDGDDDR